MNNQIIVIVQVLIAVVFILWILSRRGSSPKPTILNMNAKAEKSNITIMEESAEVAKKAKLLNVIFMWNGHCWDAYEVLGLPAGSSVQDVRQRFQELVSRSDEGQKQFLSAALSAIENKVAG